MTPHNNIGFATTASYSLHHTVKAHFCRHVDLSLKNENACHRANAQDISMKMSLLDTIHLLSNAWGNVKSVTGTNCWEKCGLKMGPCEQPVTRGPGLCAPEDIPVSQQFWTHGRTLTRICPLPDPWVVTLLLLK